MKTGELHALGITDKDTIKKLHIIHGRDMESLKDRILQTSVDNEMLRKAIAGIIDVLRTKKSLQRVLSAANTAYYLENKKDDKPVPDSEQSGEASVACREE